MFSVFVCLFLIVRLFVCLFVCLFDCCCCCAAEIQHSLCSSDECFFSTHHQMVELLLSHGTPSLLMSLINVSAEHVLVERVVFFPLSFTYLVSINFFQQNQRTIRLRRKQAQLQRCMRCKQVIQTPLG